MRAFFIKQATDWAGLAPQLVGTGADRARVLAALQAANPHLDFQKLGDGEVVLVPTLPGLRVDDGQDGSIDGQAFADLQQRLREDMAATTADARAGWAALLAEQREVGVALKTALKLAGDDPELQALAQQALDAAKNDAASAKAADASFKALEAQLHTELAGLARLLGGQTDTPPRKAGGRGGATG